MIAGPATIAGRITALHAEIDVLTDALGRARGSVRICAVSKMHPREAVGEAIAAGLTDFGENYVQEAVAKYQELPPVRKHFIGHVQTNKAKRIAEFFDEVQSVDRLEAGLALARAAESLGKVLTVLIQVNVSPVDRFGVPPREAAALAAALRATGILAVDGVMAVGPLTDDNEVTVRAFKEAANVFSEVGGSTLSLGMSGDWREAVNCGSTMIRLGTAIFGPRQFRP